MVLNYVKLDCSTVRLICIEPTEKEGIVLTNSEKSNHSVAQLVADHILSQRLSQQFFDKKSTRLRHSQEDALNAFETINQNGNAKKPQKLKRVELVFENAESIVLNPQFISRVILQHPFDRENDPFKLIGFFLIFKDTVATIGELHTYGGPDGLDRFKSYQDIVSIDLAYKDGSFESYEIDWSPLAHQNETNDNQHTVVIDGSTYLYALPQTHFKMTEVIKSALEADHFDQIVQEFSLTKQDYDVDEIRQIFQHQLSEMLKVSVNLEQKKPTSRQFDLLVNQIDEDEDFQGNNWDPTLTDRQTHEIFGGVNLESYHNLMAMDVIIPDVDQFWQGFTWLLWEISWYGIDADERQEAIEQAHQELEESEAELQEFEKQTQQMKQFIDWYVTQHISDINLPDFVATYWPLTDGMKENLIDDDDQTEVTVLKQDPDLLADFMAKYGAEYQLFERKDNQ